MSAAPSPRRGASVVICTHNRSARLLDSCHSVLAEAPESPLRELLLVDSASTDDTPQVVAALAARHPGLCRVIRVREPGLSRARNVATREAAGEVVAFLDDDATCRPGWLRALFEALEETGASAAGGPVRPRVEGRLPAWICGSMLPYLTVWDRSDERRDLAWPDLPRGTNMAFCRETLRGLGGFREDLGRKGTNLVSCEEIEVFLRLLRDGGRIVYEPRAVVDHEIPADRLSLRFMRRRFRAQGASEAVVYWNEGGRRDLVAGWRVAWAYWRAGRHEPGDWARVRNRCRALSLVGYMAAAAGILLRSVGRRPPGSG